MFASRLVCIKFLKKRHSFSIREATALVYKHSLHRIYGMIQVSATLPKRGISYDCCQLSHIFQRYAREA